MQPQSGVAETSYCALIGKQQAWLVLQKVWNWLNKFDLISLPSYVHDIVSGPVNKKSRLYIQYEVNQELPDSDVKVSDLSAAYQ